MSRRSRVLSHSARAAALVLCVAGACSAQESRPESAPAGAAARFLAAGPGASLTVLPARLGDRSFVEVGEALAVTLERAGMAHLEVGVAVFEAPAGAGAAAVASSFGDFVRRNPPATDWVLFAEIVGQPARGIEEVRATVAARDGTIVWTDRVTAADRTPEDPLPANPLEACVFIAGRLRPILGLADPLREDAPSGAMAERMRRKVGAPGDVERSAMAERTAILRKTIARSTLLVLPVLTGTTPDADGSTRLAGRLDGAGFRRVDAGKDVPSLAIRRGMNEQVALWDMARGVAAHVANHEREADYVLHAHYVMSDEAVGAVHFVLVDRKGQLVLVDYQNDHHDDFRAIAPAGREDCDRLVLRRLRRALE